MSANPVLAWDNLPLQPESAAHRDVAPAYPIQPPQPKVPALRVMPLLRTPQPRRFVRVPTHAVGVHLEQRECPRAVSEAASKVAQHRWNPRAVPCFAGDPRHQFFRRLFSLPQGTCDRRND